MVRSVRHRRPSTDHRRQAIGTSLSAPKWILSRHPIRARMCAKVSVEVLGLLKAARGVPLQHRYGGADPASDHARTPQGHRRERLRGRTGGLSNYSAPSINAYAEAAANRRGCLRSERSRTRHFMLSSLGMKLLNEARASMVLPPPVNRSEDSNFSVRARLTTPLRMRRAASVPARRSRRRLKFNWSNVELSRDHAVEPAGQELVVELLAEPAIRANRIQCSAIRNWALSSPSGGAEGRSNERYSPSNSAEIAPKARSVHHQTLQPAQRMIRRHARFWRGGIDGLGRVATHGWKTGDLEVFLEEQFLLLLTDF